uniref:Uncharacterized protein n=1 Tax=Anguilla anguilla TaxID=7936 RepID=A0A0E9UUR3_ANGAN
MTKLYSTFRCIGRCKFCVDLTYGVGVMAF